MALKEIFVASMTHVEDCVKVFSVSVDMYKHPDDDNTFLQMCEIETAFKNAMARDTALSDFEALLYANAECALPQEMKNDREARRALVCAAMKQEALRYKVGATRESNKSERKLSYTKRFLEMWSSYTLQSL